MGKPIEAFHAMLNKGEWVSWPDGNQYFVIKPQDFHSLMEQRHVTLPVSLDPDERLTSGNLAILMDTSSGRLSHS
ncbi:hypothetical protein [Rhizobium leguminosarum]|uniref:hypothetical protein n=1 Tax=Rhizobium leguminosarum TaxID=384 RepID=UPI0012BC6042|nr:hypothetical protein [Rhizobium leguminosarum]WFT86768.1 hypothetical protein QA638_03880 [Rhizobium leguminosarum]